MEEDKEIKELEERLAAMKIKRKNEIRDNLEKLQEELKIIEGEVPKRRKGGRPARLTEEEKIIKTREKGRKYYADHREQILDRQKKKRKQDRLLKEDDKISSFKLNLEK